jgi:FtsP/CotA-like multicopper oxidase with cupredoxin domain
MFHAHHDEMTQMGMGLIGMFVVHPRSPSPEYRVDRDFSSISEWSVKPGTARPNTLEMTDFNILTINGKVFPSTAPLVCRRRSGQLRLGNPGAMDHHPMHIHGHHFRITATDGDDIPLSAQWPETAVLVAVGRRATSSSSPPPETGPFTVI